MPQSSRISHTFWLPLVFDNLSCPKHQPPQTQQQRRTNRDRRGIFSYLYLIPVTETQLHFVKGRGTGNAELVAFLFVGTDNDVVKSLFSILLLIVLIRLHEFDNSPTLNLTIFESSSSLVYVFQQISFRNHSFKIQISILVPFEKGREVAIRRT